MMSDKEIYFIYKRLNEVIGENIDEIRDAFDSLAESLAQIIVRSVEVVNKVNKSKKMPFNIFIVNFMQQMKGISRTILEPVFISEVFTKAFEKCAEKNMIEGIKIEKGVEQIDEK